MNSHFEGNPSNQQRLMEFIKKSYSQEEIYALGRLLNIEKDEYVSRTMTKPQLCEAFVEIVDQRLYYSRLFVLLQSEKYIRERIWNDFGDLNLRTPLSTQHFKTLVKKQFDNEVKNQIPTSNFSEWIEEAKLKMVLVLGKDNTPETWARLELFCNHLKGFGYIPILIKQQDEIETLFNEEKMLAYASIARFIIIEKSEPAGQIDEAHICAINRFVTVWLSEEGKGDTWMQADYDYSFSHVHVLKYRKDTIEDTLKKGIDWAEDYLQKKAEHLNQFYPYR